MYSTFHPRTNLLFLTLLLVNYISIYACMDRQIFGHLNLQIYEYVNIWTLCLLCPVYQGFQLSEGSHILTYGIYMYANISIISTCVVFGISGISNRLFFQPGITHLVVFHTCLYHITMNNKPIIIIIIITSTKLG